MVLSLIFLFIGLLLGWLISRPETNHLKNRLNTAASEIQKLQQRVKAGEEAKDFSDDLGKLFASISANNLLSVRQQSVMKADLTVKQKESTFFNKK